MPKLIRGNELNEHQRREVLAAFGYRWTKENEVRARTWYKSGGHEPPTMQLQADAEWLAEHAFYVNRDGSRTARRHAEPHYLADA
jgi:hypothetical protein